MTIYLSIKTRRAAFAALVSLYFHIIYPFMFPHASLYIFCHSHTPVHTCPPLRISSILYLYLSDSILPRIYYLFPTLHIFHSHFFRHPHLPDSFIYPLNLLTLRCICRLIGSFCNIFALFYLYHSYVYIATVNYIIFFSIYL